MSDVTNDVSDTNLLALISVRPLFLRVFSTLTNCLLSKTPRRLSVLLVVLIVSLLLPLIFRRNIKDKDGHPIPPGPLFRYLAIRTYPEYVLRDWSKTYGPLFSLWMGDQLFVVISDARIAKDLLVSNGTIFSSRMPYFTKSQTILRNLAITSTPYNDTWQVASRNNNAPRPDV
jgi:Cytochrome P450